MFFIAKPGLGLIDRSGDREIKIWQCGNPPISPRSQRITNARCPSGSATAGRTVRAQYRNQRVTWVCLLRPQLRARPLPCERAEKLPNDQLELPFRGRFRVRFRGFFEHSAIIVSHLNSISHNYLRVKYFFILFTHVSQEHQKTEADRFLVPNRRIEDVEIFQTLGQQLGTLVPRPQNP